MFSSLQWIIILAIAVIGAILSPKDDSSYKKYNCYDKSIYKCGRCRKWCKWHENAKKAEEMERERENAD